MRVKPSGDKPVRGALGFLPSQTEVYVNCKGEVTVRSLLSGQMGDEERFSTGKRKSHLFPFLMSSSLPLAFARVRHCSPLGCRTPTVYCLLSNMYCVKAFPLPTLLSLPESIDRIHLTHLL